MRRINRSAERKGQRREAERQRDSQRTNRTAAEQLARLDERGLTATRERARLNAILSKES